MCTWQVEMAESLTSGKAIEHHLEMSYFLAMTKALDAHLDAAASGES